MKKTITIDKMGCLHAWHGEQAIMWKSNYYPIAVNGSKWNDSDLYIQNDGDVLDFISNLPDEEQEMLNKGYTITTDCEAIGEYFPEV
jgi:hypothetical protein